MSERIPEPPKPQAVFTLQPRSWSGASRDQVLEQRKRHLSAGQYHFYKEPLLLVEAKMQYCFDEKGKQYVDGYSNVCHVGHCHPHFVAQTQKAMENIISNTRYLHPSIGIYAERLKSKVPQELCVCYFVNSGSEANDLAIRLARGYTGRKSVVCLENAYHGTTATCTGVSTSLSTGTTKGAQDYDYCARDVVTVPVPDTYRGLHRADDPQAGRKYAKHVERACTEGGGVAAFIHESVQGVGGQIVYPVDYLKRAYEAVRANGGVTIADEVQTGFGRSGSHFWAFEAQGVVPDILTLGKPIGNGFPLGAVICRREIAQAFDGVQYFNTNGGNPVACAAGLAVLDIIEADGLQESARQLSLKFMPMLQDLKKRHKLIGDVRGVGLFVGIELVRDHRTLEPAKEETAEIMERCRHLGLLVGKGGAHNNVIRMKPPLCLNEKDLDFIIHTLDVVLNDVESRRHGSKGYEHQDDHAGRASATYNPTGAAADTSYSPVRRSKASSFADMSDDSDDEGMRRRFQSCRSNGEGRQSFRRSARTRAVDYDDDTSEKFVPSPLKDVSPRRRSSGVPAALAELVDSSRRSQRQPLRRDTLSSVDTRADSSDDDDVAPRRDRVSQRKSARASSGVPPALAQLVESSGRKSFSHRASGRQTPGKVRFSIGGGDADRDSDDDRRPAGNKYALSP